MGDVGHEVPAHLVEAGGLGGVAGDHHHALDPAGGLAGSAAGGGGRGAEGGAREGDGAALGRAQLGHRALALAALQGGVDDGAELGQARELQRGAAAHLAGDPEEAPELRVDQERPAVAVGHQDPVGHAAHDRLQVVALGADPGDLLLDPAGQPVERGAERGQVRLLRHRQPPRVIAGGQGLGVRGHPAEGAEEAPGEPGEDDRGDRQGGERGEGDGADQAVLDRFELVERLGQAQDVAAAVGAGEGAGGVGVGDAGRVAAADARAGALGEGLGDLGARGVVVHRPELFPVALAVGEHRAVAGDHGEAQAAVLGEVGDPGLERARLARDAVGELRGEDRQALGELLAGAGLDRPRHQGPEQDRRDQDGRHGGPERRQLELG